MAMGNTNFEVSDPGFYDILISDQKKKTSTDPSNSTNWVELGRLQDAKSQMTALFAKKKLTIKWLPPITYIFFGVFLYVYINNYVHLVPWPVMIPVLFFCIAVMIRMALIRYPRSGKRYFQKAISIDSSNTDAYMYLGLIALRKFQKKKAYSLFERALVIEPNKKLERELRTFYQKEFMSFFDKKSENEKALQETIFSFEKQLKSLEAENEGLKNKNSIFLKKAKATKAKTSHTIRETKIDMEIQLEKIHNDYEKQIDDLEQAMEVEEIQKESSRRKILRLNLEIMEANSQKKKYSFDQATKKVENILGSNLWAVMSKQTKSYLSTAEQAFSMIDKNSKETDFSLVGMELCKALETEINQKLIRPFIKNLNEKSEQFLRTNKTREIKGLPVYFTMLAKVADNQNYLEITNFTLGQYLFVLKKTLEGEYALDKYGDYLENVFKSYSIDIGRKFLQKLKIVTNDYRNSIVHYTQMDFEQCHKLRELIFIKPDSLLVACCRIHETNFLNMEYNRYSDE